jgi:hypothetical protein
MQAASGRQFAGTGRCREFIDQFSQSGCGWRTGIFQSGLNLAGTDQGIDH